MKIKFALLRGGFGCGGRVPNAVFLGKRHDNKILKVHMLLSRSFVVIAQAPRIVSGFPKWTLFFVCANRASWG